MWTVLRCSLFLLFAVVWSLADAHDSRLAFLNIDSEGDNTFIVDWKVPIIDGEVVAKEISFNQGWEAELLSQRTTSTYERFSYRVYSDDEGALEVRFIGNERDRIAVVVLEDGERSTLANDELVYDGPQTWTAPKVVWFYLLLGIDHILLGIDHLLFVFALLFVAVKPKKLIWTITAFTLAHSVTLAISAMDLFQLPIPPVEAIIALSIVFLAIEILNHKSSRPSLTYRKPWLVALAFGLLHGFGFASALSETGLPDDRMILSLASFNAGVELGQLIFVGIALGFYRLIKPWVSGSTFLKKLSVYAVGGIAAFWVFERVIGML